MSSEKVTRRKFLKYGAAGAVGVAAIAAIGYEGYQYLNPPAPKEPLLVVTWGGAYVDSQKPIEQAFTSATEIPIKDELHTGGAAAVIARIKADLPNMTRDVVGAWNPVWYAMDQSGWLAPLTPDKVPAMNEYPDAAKYVGPSGNTVGLGWDAIINYFAYRSDLLPSDLQPLDNIDKLLDPRLKGKIAITDMVEALGSDLMIFAYAKGGNEKQNQPGWDFLKQLAEAGQIGSVVTSDAEVINGFTTGSSWVGIGWSNILATLNKSNVPVKVDFSASLKVPLAMEGFCVTNSPRVEESYKWVDFFSRAENIQGFAKGLGVIPFNTKAQGDPTLEKYYPTDYSSQTFAPDWGYVLNQSEAWSKQFESDILPLLKHG